MIGIGGAIGDICGSGYEFDNLQFVEDLKLFEGRSVFTDDTVMTCAVGEWLLGEDHSVEKLSEIMRELGVLYPRCGYGGMFWRWITGELQGDYGSYGNGAGMRVGLVGWYAKTEAECLDLAEKTAKTTHGHVEGIKGAQAIALAVFLARNGATKEKIKKEISEKFNYNLDLTLDEIGRKIHGFDCTCQVTVPEAIICFLQGNDFEDVIRKSIIIGGDTDTIACMAGFIAEAYYGIPAIYVEKAKSRLTSRLYKVFVDMGNYVDSQFPLGEYSGYYRTPKGKDLKMTQEEAELALEEWKKDFHL